MNISKVTTKDIVHQLGVSQRTASTYMNDIKQHYGIRIVLFSHIVDYFKLPNKI